MNEYYRMIGELKYNFFGGNKQIDLVSLVKYTKFYKLNIRNKQFYVQKTIL